MINGALHIFVPEQIEDMILINVTDIWHVICSKWLLMGKT